jgi:hypothetical protein
MPQSASPHRWMRILGTAALTFTLAAVDLPEAQAQQQKPNILVVMGDDIGWFNPSIYHRGIMGYQTPNIDRIAQEGAMFTDWYGQQSCTAGRAAFVTGQSPIRSDDGDLLALRINQWKISFKEQEHTGLNVWQREFTNLRAPRIYNLCTDPFEQGPTSFEYGKWMAERMFLIVPSQVVVGQWLATFKDFPIRQKPASFNLDEVMQKLSSAQKQ